MGVATEELRSPRAVVNFFGMRTVYVSAFIAAFSTIFAFIVWLMNRRYFSYLLRVVETALDREGFRHRRGAGS